MGYCGSLGCVSNYWINLNLIADLLKQESYHPFDRISCNGDFVLMNCAKKQFEVIKNLDKQLSALSINDKIVQ